MTSPPGIRNLPIGTRRLNAQPDLVLKGLDFFLGGVRDNLTLHIRWQCTLATHRDHRLQLQFALANCEI